MKKVYIFTDGSCNTKSGDGAWAYLLDYNGHRKQAAKFVANTTNNRMELKAAVEALASLKEACQVVLTTDSQYLKRAFTDGWLNKWQKNGWQTANRKDVKNKDLWQELLKLDDIHELSWEWTRGHVGHEENEIVDKLALKTRKTGSKC